MRWQRGELQVRPAGVTLRAQPGAPILRGVLGRYLLLSCSCGPPPRDGEDRRDARAACAYHEALKPLAGPDGSTPPPPLRLATRPLDRGVAAVRLALIGDAARAHRPALDLALLLALRDLGWTPIADHPAWVEQSLDATVESAAYSVAMELRSPLQLKRNRKLERTEARIDFPMVADFLLGRLSRLDLLYGSGRGLDVKPLQALAREVATTERALEWKQGQQSGDAGKRVDLSGWLGRLRFEPVPGELVRMLRAGEDLGVGSHTIYGLGDYDLRIDRL